MRLIVLLLTTLCYDTPGFIGARAEVQKNIRVTTNKRFGRLTKRQEDLGYLEQCSILQFWDKQIGRVNVLAFFDSTWPFSHRQAAMLKVLRERFDKTGFEDIQFLAINAAPGESEYVSRAEIEVEEETWRQISPSEAEGLPAVVASAEALAAALGPDVYFVQDSAELQIWPRLRAFRDQILVIDRCGRLTYQVIVPWSILHFPYVKAAILSTYKDEPCGRCELQPAFGDRSGEDSGEGSGEPSEARTGRPESDESTTIGRAPTGDASAASEPLLSHSTEDDYDTQTVALTTPIDANDATLPPRENATSIERVDTTTTQQTVTLPDDEPSTYASRTDNYDETTVTPDDESTANSTDLYDYDSPAQHSRDDDYSNATDSGYDDADDANLTTTTGNPDAEELTTTVTDEMVPVGRREGFFEMRTEHSPSPDRSRTTDEPTSSSESSGGGERRLAEAKEIESLDARDVLKSRSTNARSVSASEGSDERLRVVEAKSEQEGQLEADYLIPIRIIMRAPHVDEYSDRSLQAHEYLVLKTGQPTYHEHLQPGDPQPREAVRSSFARDESPGLYGELADYWQSYAGEQAQDEAAASADDDEHERVLEQEQSFADERTKALEADNEQHGDEHSASYEDADVIDEEAKSKLIAHYSKLLPWLYYVLAK